MSSGDHRCPQVSSGVSLISLLLLQRSSYSLVSLFQVSRDSGAELWLADIQEAVKEANQESQKALKRESEVTEVTDQYKLISSVCVCSVCLAVAAVNQAVKEQKVSQTLRVLALPEVLLQGIIPACAADYQRELYSLISDRIHTGHIHSHTRSGCYSQMKSDIFPSVFLNSVISCG